MEQEPVHFLFGFQTNGDAIDWAKANASGDFSTLIGIQRRYRYEFRRQATFWYFVWLGPDIFHFLSG